MQFKIGIYIYKPMLVPTERIIAKNAMNKLITQLESDNRDTAFTFKPDKKVDGINIFFLYIIPEERINKITRQEIISSLHRFIAYTNSPNYEYIFIE